MAFGRFSQSLQTPAEVSAEEKPLVLVIDDDVRIRNALEFTLRQQYTIKLCASGREGINQVDEKVYVVILDIKMPDKDGFQVYEEIKAKFPTIPIIFYSAFQSIMEAASVRQTYKPFSYVDKNGETKELLTSIERAVRHYRTIRNLADTQRQLQAVRKQE